MNTNENGRHNQDQERADVTALALNQLSDDRADEIRGRLSKNPQLQQESNEAGRMAGLVESANTVDLPSDISGLERKIDEAFSEVSKSGVVASVGGDVSLGGQSSVRALSQPSSFWSGRRILAVAATTVLIAGGSYLLITSEFTEQTAMHSIPPIEIDVDDLAVHGKFQRETLETMSIEEGVEGAIELSIDESAERDDEMKAIVNAISGGSAELDVDQVQSGTTVVDESMFQIPANLDIPLTQGSFFESIPGFGSAGNIGDSQNLNRQTAQQQSGGSFVPSQASGLERPNSLEFRNEISDNHSFASDEGQQGKSSTSTVRGFSGGETVYDATDSNAPKSLQNEQSGSQAGETRFELKDDALMVRNDPANSGGNANANPQIMREVLKKPKQVTRATAMPASIAPPVVVGVVDKPVGGSIAGRSTRIEDGQNPNAKYSTLGPKGDSGNETLERAIVGDFAAATGSKKLGLKLDESFSKEKRTEVRTATATEMNYLTGDELGERDGLSRSRKFYYHDVKTRDPDTRTNEQYELPPENQFQRPVLDLARSTFAIDVDTASYANARRFINSRQLPPPNAVRVEEFINYFNYGYAQPVDEKPFAVDMEVANCPWDESHKLLQIGIKGKEIAQDDRPPSNLVFLIDVSGSMSDQNKLPLLQRSMLMLVDRLTENDRVTIVTYAGNAGLRMGPTSGDQKEKIRAVIQGLSSGGSTHGSAGIRMAYEMASKNFIANGTNRVILATDGDLNVGVTADDALVSLIKNKAELGVFLSVLGFGTGNLKDAKLEKLADNGNGQYSYIDSIREARKVLVEEMTGSLITIAKDVKIQIEFNPAEIASYRLIGYENRVLKNEDFDNDGVDAGDIGAGHTVTAIYELVPVGAEVDVEIIESTPPLKYQTRAFIDVVDKVDSIQLDGEHKYRLTEAAQSGELMTLALRFKEPDAHESDRIEFIIKDANTPFDEASQDFRFAASVASYGMLLRHSRHTGTWKLTDVENAAASALGEDANGHRAEFVDLVRQTRAIVGH